jgi:single-strand DNA-binding protein
MADGLNRWTGLGQLGADAEIRQTTAGEPVCNFRIACTESYLDRNKERQEKTEWVSCTLWGKRGEALAPYLTTGAKVYVEGSLQTRSWDKDGEKRYKTEVRVANVILCGNKQGGGKGGERRSGTASTEGHGMPAPPDDYDPDQVPF